MRKEAGPESGTEATSVDELNAAIVAARADLLRRAFYLTRDRDQAMELLQRTVERACASRRQLRPGSNPAHWLGAILTSQFIDEFRRHRASPFSRSLSYDNVAAPSAEPIPVWSSLGIDDVVAAARGMPEHFRRPFELHVMRGLSHRAISLRLGLPMGTIATRIFRAKRLLRRILGERVLHGPAIAVLPIRASPRREGDAVQPPPFPAVSYAGRKARFPAGSSTMVSHPP